MAKTVVTGGSGFIGSHVVDVLLEAGHEVTVVDHRVRPHRDDVRFEDVDLMDLSSVLAATKGAEHIFHLAAVSNVNYAFKYPVYTTALNVVGTANVLVRLLAKLGSHDIRMVHDGLSALESAAKDPPPRRMQK